jgi:hypothetical protein
MDAMKEAAFFFADHFIPAGKAALCFFAGALAVIPVVKLNRNACEIASSRLLRTVSKLFGRHPGPLRTALTIFLFNGTAIFVYMSLGINPVVPKVIAVLTGFTIALCFAAPQHVEGVFEFPVRRADDWVPSTSLTIVCGIATALLELPCFFFSIGMGITLGKEVITHQTAYLSALETRAMVYATVVLPLLFLSAICETIAIRGAAGRR